MQLCLVTGRRAFPERGLSPLVSISFQAHNHGTSAQLAIKDSAVGYATPCNGNVLQGFVGGVIGARSKKRIALGMIDPCVCESALAVDDRERCAVQVLPLRQRCGISAVRLRVKVTSAGATRLSVSMLCLSVRSRAIVDSRVTGCPDR